MRAIASIALIIAVFVGFMLTWLGLGLVHTSEGGAWVMAGIGVATMWLSGSKLRVLWRQ